METEGDYTPLKYAQTSKARTGSFKKQVTRGNSLISNAESVSKQELQIPSHLEDKVMLNYHNVLPSNIRHGKNKPMPLVPQGLDKVLTKTDRFLFHRVLGNSSYCLSQGFKSKQKYIEEQF